MERINLFESGAGWPCYRIPGLVRTKSGTLIAYCETRLSGSDWTTRGVAARRSEDGGKTWLPMRQLVQNENLAVNNPVMIAGADGTVHLLWQTDYNKLYYQSSSDDGCNYGPARELDVYESYRPDLDWTVFAVGPGHGIETRSGALIVPTWIAKGQGRDHFPSTVSCIRSDDHGVTWKRGELIRPEPPEFDSPNETAVVECADGTLLYNIRNRGTVYRRYAMQSRDGLTFTKPMMDPALPDPRCFGSVAAAGQDIALVNCASETHRTQLTLRLSHDNGKTWPISRVLEAGIAGYADLAFTPDGSEGYCFFESSNPDWPQPYPQALCFARFSIDWLKA